MAEGRICESALSKSAYLYRRSDSEIEFVGRLKYQKGNRTLRPASSQPSATTGRRVSVLCTQSVRSFSETTGRFDQNSSTSVFYSNSVMKATTAMHEGSLEQRGYSEKLFPGPLLRCEMSLQI